MSNPFSNTTQVNAVIRIRRGTEQERLANTFDVGELVYSTDKKRLFVGDGSSDTSVDGGIVVGNKVWLTDNFQKLDQIEKYDLVYRTDPDFTGFYMLTGNNPLNVDHYILFGGDKFLKNISNYVLTPATVNSIGGVKIKSGLTIESDGGLSVSIDSDTMEIINNKLKVKNPYTGGGSVSSVGLASYVGAGIVKLSQTSGITVDNNGTLGLNLDNSTIKLSSTIDGSKLYVDSSRLTFPSLPVASSVTLGGIKIGSGLSATNEGVTVLKSATDSDFGGLILGDGLSANPNTGKVDVNPNTISNFNASLSVNGYTSLPGGLLMQWGSGGYIGSNGAYSFVVFPIPFPNASFNVVVSPSHTWANNGVHDGWYVSNVTLTGFKLRTDSDTAITDYYWQALGY